MITNVMVPYSLGFKVWGLGIITNVMVPYSLHN